MAKRYLLDTSAILASWQGEEGSDNEHAKYAKGLNMERQWEYQLDVSFFFQSPEKTLAKVAEDEAEERHLFNLKLETSHLSLLRGLEELLCLETLKGVEKYWYQVEVAKRVIRDLKGRAILADEVGLGKTIEAGMVISEYLMRGMDRKVLILTPPSFPSGGRRCPVNLASIS